MLFDFRNISNKCQLLENQSVRTPNQTRSRKSGSCCFGVDTTTGVDLGGMTFISDRAQTLASVYPGCNTCQTHSCRLHYPETLHIVYKKL